MDWKDERTGDLILIVVPGILALQFLSNGWEYLGSVWCIVMLLHVSLFMSREQPNSADGIDFHRVLLGLYSVVFMVALGVVYYPS